MLMGKAINMCPQTFEEPNSTIILNHDNIVCSLIFKTKLLSMSNKMLISAKDKRKRIVMEE